MDKNPVLNAIFNRRSIRKFTAQTLDEATITTLLQAGMAAPTACNSQPWEFIVITDPEVLARIRRKLPFARQNAPCGIVVLGNPAIAGNIVGRDFWEQDCSAAMENMHIAAVGLGLGSVWIGIHPVEAFVRGVRAVLKIPEEVTPLGMMHVGYPAEKKPPRTQYDEKKVHWQRYAQYQEHSKVRDAGSEP